jgi:hypothetical protein
MFKLHLEIVIPEIPRFFSDSSVNLEIFSFAFLIAKSEIVIYIALVWVTDSH